MASKMDEFEPLLKELCVIPDSQVALALLRHCGGFCRLVFYMRSLGHCGARAYLERFDAAVLETLCSIIGAPDGQLSESVRMQAALGIRRGGLGVRRVAEHAEAAALAAASGTFDLCVQLDPAFTWDAEGWRRSATAYNGRVDEEAQVDPEERGKVRQRVLSQAIEARQHRELLRDGDEATRARFLSLSLKGAGAFLSAVPSYELAIPNGAFRGLLRLRLDLPVWDEGAQCRLCFGDMDPFGRHVFECARNADRITRHDVTARALYGVCSDLGLGPQLEKKEIVAGRQSRPADVFLPVGSGAEARGRCVDVSVASCLAASMLTGAARTAGYAASMREAVKRKRCGELCEGLGLSFSPFVLECFGGFGSEALDLLRRLGKRGGRQIGAAGSAVTQSLMERVSVAFQRELGMSFERRGPIGSGSVARVPVPALRDPPPLPRWTEPDQQVVHDVAGDAHLEEMEVDGCDLAGVARPSGLPRRRLSPAELLAASAAGGVTASGVVVPPLPADVVAAAPPPSQAGMPPPPASPEAPPPQGVLDSPPAVVRGPRAGAAAPPAGAAAAAVSGPAAGDVAPPLEDVDGPRGVLDGLPPPLSPCLPPCRPGCW
eukprot:Rhum_TRINITY_DN11163_c1_g1::Rhum_TRINITY_DN11163_c1_g1_i1::g.42832::m.42832